MRPKHLVVDISFLHMIGGSSVQFDDASLGVIFDQEGKPPASIAAITHDIPGGALGDPITAPKPKKFQ